MNSNRKGRDFLARHGETVFNAVGRMQGGQLHTPLTRRGFAQAEEMGMAMRATLGPRPPLTLWSSPAGRALQTLSVITEHLELDWHQTHADERLGEINVGSWGGQYYREIAEQSGPMLDPASGALRAAPDGEDYSSVAARLRAWLADTDADPGDRLIIMHGISSAVLRALMTAYPATASLGVPIVPQLPQGSVVMIEQTRESVVHLGSGRG